MTPSDYLAIIAGILSAGSLYVTKRNDRERDALQTEMVSLRARIGQVEKDHGVLAAVVGEIRDDVKEIKKKLFGIA